ncbi:MAG: hypothetical protein U9Q40_06260 [Campylobacterota bacterium]|nr:hypothetical protein [Campylobacterota bacterium]
MKYSYITPRHKSALTKEIQLLVTFFTITLFMLFMTYFFLLIRDYNYVEDMNEIAVVQSELEENIVKMKSQIAFIEKEALLAQKVYTKNTVLKDSITNLFDLVPQRITLSEAKLLENGLILYGVTPNKDVYNFMLQAPLRSIFHRTYSSFHPAENGWLRFVSTNYIDEELNLSQERDSED